MKKVQVIHYIKPALSISVVFSLFIIIAYFITFSNGISKSTTDWANFGSLLAGVFTFCGSLATIATLLFIHEENKANQEVIQHQTEALAFEQYLKHRDLFITLITETAKSNPRAIEIQNIDDLYKKIFPNNKPTNRPIYAVELTSAKECKPGDLTDIVTCYNKLATASNNNSPVYSYRLQKLMDMLHINCLEEKVNGDLVFKGNNLGINIYDLKSKTEEITKIINALLYFTGNNSIDSISHCANSRSLKLTTIKHFLHNKNNHLGLEVTKSKNILTVLEEIYLEFSENPELQYLFKDTKRNINKGFSNKEEVSSLLKNVKSFTMTYNAKLLSIKRSGGKFNAQEKYCINLAEKSIERLHLTNQGFPI